jgi:hypothetical protein
MSSIFIKEPCCENFCLSCGGIAPELPKYFSNLNLYLKPLVNDNSSQNPDSTKYTWNNFLGLYEPIWEWRGFIRTFPVNGNTLPVRLIQNSSVGPSGSGNGLVWFLQIRNWANPINQIAQQNDYGIICYYSNTFQTFNDYPSGDFTLNDGSSTVYTPTLNNFNSLIAADQRFPISITEGYCDFIYN